MGDWHEHEAKAECIDLRRRVREMEAQRAIVDRVDRVMREEDGEIRWCPYEEHYLVSKFRFRDDGGTEVAMPTFWGALVALVGSIPNHQTAADCREDSPE